MRRYLPILDWARGYSTRTLESDLIAAVIVTIMLIPQSLAYALLAGLPPEVGLYASIAPLVLYGVFGTSRALAVGPVAVVSLMTATALGEVAAQGSAEYIEAAIVLAVMSGAMLVALGLFRLGFIANFLSHPVISGFITASGILIALSQVKHLLGVEVDGKTLPEVLPGLWSSLGSINSATLAIGLLTLGFLFWARGRLKPALLARGLPSRLADILAKAGPVAAVALTTSAVWAFDLSDIGVKTVGSVPAGLPPLSVPSLSPELWSSLALPALLISIVGFVESVSVAQTLAAKRRQRIDPDQELIGLGASNIGAGLSGGYPVTGGFARSVVNFDAGAETPAAGIFTALGIGLATLTLTPLLYHLPVATLAATIIVAVLSLVDLKAPLRVLRYSRTDFAAQAATILLTLAVGVEAGIVAGVGISVLMHLYRSSRPHSAIVGQVPGTEHFRNVERHEVVIDPSILSLRVDESLYFANARFLEERILGAVASDPAIRHVVLMCTAVNAIDASALESLEAINHRLADGDVTFHLSEVKGPVMDRLARTSFCESLTGRVFLTQYDAFHALAPQIAEDTMRAPRCGIARTA